MDVTSKQDRCHHIGFISFDEEVGPFLGKSPLQNLIPFLTSLEVRNVIFSIDKCHNKDMSYAVELKDIDRIS
jgi:hypothetical protein